MTHSADSGPPCECDLMCRHPARCPRTEYEPVTQNAEYAGRLAEIGKRLDVLLDDCSSERLWAKASAWAELHTIEKAAGLAPTPASPNGRSA